MLPKLRMWEYFENLQHIQRNEMCVKISWIPFRAAIVVYHKGISLVEQSFLFHMYVPRHNKAANPLKNGELGYLMNLIILFHIFYNFNESIFIGGVILSLYSMTRKRIPVINKTELHISLQFRLLPSISTLGILGQNSLKVVIISKLL